MDTPFPILEIDELLLSLLWTRYFHKWLLRKTQLGTSLVWGGTDMAAGT